MAHKQEEIVGAFCGLGTLMLQSIYGKEYRLDLKFESKRNKSEAKLSVLKGDIELSLDEETGGGIVDVVALAMRFALWSLMEPRTDPLFIMDEPAKFVSKDKLPMFGRMLKQICETLGIQVVMVSHEDELVNIADRSYRVDIKNGVSKVMC
jgi:DNA repair exonuclease SbcCD ATPase subunit